MKPFVLCTIDPASIVVHRKAAKGPDVYRATADVNYEGTPDLEGFKAVLQTPDARSVCE